jgi:type IV secretory pathway VirJ component
MKIPGICFIVCILLTTAPTRAAESLDTFVPFGTVHLYYQPDNISSVTLFISGDGGWNEGVVNMAKILAGMQSLVIGVDIRGYIRHLNSFSGKCCYPPADFENLSKFIQQKMGLSTYLPPIIIGYSSGATLAYALVAQAPHGTFLGAISMGFCPDLPITKPFCRQNGLLWNAAPHGKGVIFEPDSGLKTPWIAFQGQVDQVCSPAMVDRYVRETGSARLVALPDVGHGFSAGKNWVPQFKSAFASLTPAKKSTPPPTAHQAEIGNLPLIEIQAPGIAQDLFAIVLSGDGGWAGIDKGIAEALVNDGIPVVGFNSLQYFWKPRTPEEASRDLDKIINHYCIAWKKSHVLVIGYSFGADVLPFMATGLPAASIDRIDLFAFLGLSSKTDFRFHLTDWIGGGPAATARPVLPEIEKLKGRPMLYIYGTEESDHLAAQIDRKAVKVIAFNGGHHFGGNYRMLADSILAAAKMK